VPGVEVPDHIFQRLRKVPPARQTAEGVKLAAEIVQQVGEIPGVAGVHLLVAGNEQAVPDILDRAGVRVSREPGDHDGR
jgi:5,10-methylenetetrahydrofolate reductase